MMVENYKALAGAFGTTLGELKVSKIIRSTYFGPFGGLGKVHVVFGKASHVCDADRLLARALKHHPFAAMFYRFHLAC